VSHMRQEHPPGGALVRLGGAGCVEADEACSRRPLLGRIGNSKATETAGRPRQASVG